MSATEVFIMNTYLFIRKPYLSRWNSRNFIIQAFEEFMKTHATPCLIFVCYLFSTSIGDSAASLLCCLCKDSFPSAWELMVHAQAAHMVNIYELGTKSEGNSASRRVNNKESSQSPTPQDQVNMTHLIISSDYSRLNLLRVTSTDAHIILTIP